MDNINLTETGIFLDDETEAQDANRYIGSEAVPYRVSDKIKNRVNSVDDLEKIFDAQESIKPEHLNLDGEVNYSDPRAEFVQLESVVGGADAARYNGTFLVYEKGSEPEGRGRQRIFEIAKSYSDGRDLDPQKPQEYYEWKGKYYVTSGRHSTAALKALGVPQIPAMVIHITSK